MINQSEAPASEKILVQKHRSGLSALSVATGKTRSGLTGGARLSITPEKTIPKKENINP